MSSFYELIRRIQRRPSMYLGKPSISNLSSFLSGYIVARRELDLPQTSEEKEFSEFQSWIKSKFRISSDQSWDKVILFFSEDENSALIKFFKLFEEFTNSKPESSQMPRAIKPPTIDPHPLSQQNLMTTGPSTENASSP